MYTSVLGRDLDSVTVDIGWRLRGKFLGAGLIRNANDDIRRDEIDKNNIVMIAGVVFLRNNHCLK